MARYKVENGELIPTDRAGQQTKGAVYKALSRAPIPGATRRTSRRSVKLPAPSAPTGRPRRGNRRNASRDAAEAGVRFQVQGKPRKSRQAPPAVPPQPAPAPAAVATDAPGGPVCAYCGKQLVNKRAGAKFCGTNCKALFSYHKGKKPEKRTQAAITAGAKP